MAGTPAVGLTTGGFAVFWHADMPDLATTDDLTFDNAFQTIDKRSANSRAGRRRWMCSPSSAPNTRCNAWLR